MRLLLAPVFWLGRVTLWVFVFPLGLWRSLHHGAEKRNRKIVNAIREQKS